jgi:hypothetical protein
MKNSAESLSTQKKLKRRKVIVKAVSSITIARRYMELRRLRERVSEIEAFQSAR